jgi:hypothetical protein
MTSRFKKIFLIASVIIPFLLYSLYYYGMMVKNAPYKFSEFQSMRFEYGFKDSLLNKYDSHTGNYQYVTTRDSVIKMHLKLTKDDMLYLHRKAAELGFWDFPANETYVGKRHSPRYVMEFKYARKTKRVVFDAAFDGNEKLVDANERLIKEIQRVLSDAERREKK